MDQMRLIEEQKRLARRIRIPAPGQGYQPRQGDLVFGLDVQYAGDRAYVGVDVCEWQGQAIHSQDIQSQDIQSQDIQNQDRSFSRGSSYAAAVHTRTPYVSGLFCFREGPPLLKTGTPAIGCAKRALLRYTGQVGRKRGTVLQIEDQGEVVGAALTTRDDVKPVFVSPGYEISLDASLDVILALSRYRIPDPLRRADQIARAWAQGRTLDGVTDLGQLD